MIEKKRSKIDWLFIVFLLLFTNQAVLSLKVVGLIFICLARWNWKFGFNKERLPRFFVFILLLSAFNFAFITREFTTEYISAFIMGNLFWLFSLISIHQVKLSIEKYGNESVLRAMKIFVVINFIVCVYQLVNIMLITGTINPYNEMLEFPYGMSTGDNIFGAFMQNSYYNNMVSAILAVYFIFKRQFLYAILAVCCLVLVFGNFGTIVFIGIITALFFVGLFGLATRSVKSPFFVWVRQVSPPGRFYLYLPGITVMIIVMYYIASPRNLIYIVDKAKDKIFSVKSNDENNYGTMIADQKLKTEAYDPFSDYLDRMEQARIGNTNVKNFSPNATLTAEQVDAKLTLTQTYIDKLQGKNLSVLETIAFLKSSGTNLLFGAGTTRFSSLIAQKMSGYDSSRIFLNVLPHYIAKSYAENHMLLIKIRNESEDKALYSTANWPDSLYNQLFGEYGITGAFLFLVFYLGFFAKNIRKCSYGLWIVAILLPFAHLNYVFDTLCVMPFFELLMFADIDEHLNKAGENG